MKTALSIRYEDAPVEVQAVTGMSRVALWIDFYETPTVLLDRATCESDETYLQLLPYITVFDHVGRVFHYLRGKAGAESRLTGKLSIGLGGHVDTVVPQSKTLLQHLQAEASRELEEEIGITPRHPLVFKAFIVDRTNAVGRVHLGLHATYQLTQEEEALVTLEAGQIEEGSFLAARQVNERELFNRLENWSQTVAVTLF